jgi:tRNA(Ile2) C34 agmatinyltransferase TiaS
MSATLAAPLPRMHAPPAVTLEAVVCDAWDTVVSGEVTDCPVCGGLMQPRWSAVAGVVGGRCSDCGTTLE